MFRRRTTFSFPNFLHFHHLMGLTQDHCATYKCQVHDLTALMCNQDLLTHFRRDITGQYQLMDSNHYQIDEEFPEMPMEESFDAKRFLRIYEVQYQIVTKLCTAGIQVDMNALNDTQRERHQFVMSQLVKDRPSPHQMNAIVDRVLKACHEGDIIDVMGYRGTGYNLVTEKRDWHENGTHLVEVKCSKTIGPYGCHLPEDGWHWVSLYGTDFYEKCDLWGCQLPTNTMYRMVDRAQEFKTDDNKLFSWLEKHQLLNIGGFEVIGRVLDQDATHATLCMDRHPIVL